jgi:hypothetical protein
VSAESIASKVAAVVGLPADDERVLDAVDAAYQRASIYVYGADPTAAVLPDDDPIVVTGLVTLAGGYLQQTQAPTGVVESDTYTGAALPDPLTVCHDCFDHLRTGASYGIA